MSFETALVKANAVDVRYQAFLAEVAEADDFGDAAMAKPATGAAAVDRLHRPGSEYLNMNPYYVLMLEPGCSLEEVKAAFRRASLQVHPDKHGGAPRAAAAFEAVRAAYAKMEDESKLDLCNRVCEGARKRLEEQLRHQRKALRKAGKAAGDGGAAADPPPVTVPEDDPAAFRRAYRQFVSRMFVEFEQRRQQLRERDERGRKREAEEAALEAEEAERARKEAKAWEKSRQKRVAGWRAWATGSGRGLKRPPAVRAEGAQAREEAFQERGLEWRRDWR